MSSLVSVWHMGFKWTWGVFAAFVLVAAWYAGAQEATVAGDPADAFAVTETATPTAATDANTTAVPLTLEPTEPAGSATHSAAFGEPIVAAGDTIRILMLEDPDVNFEGAVSIGGTVVIPYLGEFRVVGMRESEAATALSAALERELYQRATVTVTLVSRGPGTVYIYGAARGPGGYPVPKYGNLTILRLLLLAGGLSGWAAPEDTFILRRNPGSDKVERVSVNLREIFATAIPEGERDLTLIDGDIVCVPGMNGELYQFMTMEDREVIVIGAVGKPGPITFGPGEVRTVMRAIFKAGGFSQFAKSNAVKIIRYERNQERSEMVVDAEAIMEKGYLHKDIELQPGDMLIVPQKRVNF